MEEKSTYFLPHFLECLIAFYIENDGDQKRDQIIHHDVSSVHVTLKPNIFWTLKRKKITKKALNKRAFLVTSNRNHQLIPI